MRLPRRVCGAFDVVRTHTLLDLLGMAARWRWSWALAMAVLRWRAANRRPGVQPNAGWLVGTRESRAEWVARWRG